MNPRILRLLALLPVIWAANGVWSAELINDRPITIASARDVTNKRRALIQYVWGDAGFPDQRLPSVIVTNVPSPVRQLTHLARVDELRFDLAPSLQGLAYHFVPDQPNREMVIVHHGHACTLDDDPSPTDLGYGLQRSRRSRPSPQTSSNPQPAG